MPRIYRWTVHWHDQSWQHFFAQECVPDCVSDLAAFAGPNLARFWTNGECVGIARDYKSITRAPLPSSYFSQEPAQYQWRLEVDSLVVDDVCAAAGRMVPSQLHHAVVQTLIRKLDEYEAILNERS